MACRACVRVGLFIAAIATPYSACASDVDTQFIFGFTRGADVGELGEREIESQTIGRFGKADGSYAAISSELRAEFTPFENFRFELGAFVAQHSIAGVSGFNDRSSFQFGGVELEARYRLLDRRFAPVGLTLGVEPHWARVDDQNGQPVTNWGGTLTLSVDKELVEDRLFGAVNLLYDPEWTYRSFADGWVLQSTVGVSAALVAQVDEGIFAGAEAHYLRSYNGVGFEIFGGDAFFFGPVTYLRVSRRFAVSAAWSVQVAGGAVGAPGPLNLQDFERHQARLRFEYTF